MRERGAAAVVMTAVAALMILVSVGVVAVGMAVAARSQAATAADAAALAAAVATFPGAGRGDPVSEANRVARINGAGVFSCVCGVDERLGVRTVTVGAVVEVDLPLLGRIEVRQMARAEFDPLRYLVPGT